MLKKYISHFQLARDQIRYKLGLKLFDFENKQPIKLIAPKHFVFLRIDAKWGDAIVSSFIFQEIRHAYPDAKISVISTPKMTSLFKDHFQVDEVFEIKKRAGYKALGKLAKALSEVDVLVHMSERLKMKDLFLLSKVQAKIIAGLDDQVKMINLKLGQKTQGMHFADKFATLLKMLSIEVNNFHYKVPMKQEAESSVASLLATKSNKSLIAINPYGQSRSRKMTPELTTWMIEELLKINPNLIIAILHAPETKNEVELLCSQFSPDKVFYDHNSTSIFDAIALIKQAQIVISVDTAIVHIATGLQKPTLGLYNPDPENFSAWHPRNEKAICLFSKKIVPHNISNIDQHELKKGIEEILKTYLDSSTK